VLPEPPGQVLEPVPQAEQLLAVAPQFAGEPGGGDALGEAPEDQHQFDGPPLGALKRGAREGVEHAAAGLAAVVQDRGAVAAVDGQALTCPAPRAGQAVGVQPADELGVAGTLVHQIREGEVHG
jgi:hypothetical protein